MTTLSYTAVTRLPAVMRTIAVIPHGYSVGAMRLVRGMQVGGVPMKRLGTINEVLRGVDFLLSAHGEDAKRTLACTCTNRGGGEGL